MSTTKVSACIWRGRTEPRGIRGRHANECESASCAGCCPCPERHCRCCGIEHVTAEGIGSDQTCAGCLSETRTNLTEIVAKSGKLIDEAVHRGINSEAANLAGPAIDTPEGIEAHGYRRMSMLMGRIPGVEQDERHPLWVLGSWETIARDHLGQDADETHRITLTAARGYLDRQLHILAHDEGFPFDEMARDLDRCRSHLEDVLRDGEQVEKGAPCMKCERPLTKTTEVGGGVVYECERCHDRLTESRYRLAVKQAHVENADRLNVDDLAERIGVPASSIRRWASARRVQTAGHAVTVLAALIRSCGRDGNGRKVYRVSDALAVRDAGGDRRGSGTVSNARGDKCAPDQAP